MVIPLLIIFVVLVIIVLRMEFLMADFSRLTAAVDALTIAVDAAVNALNAGHGEDPAVQRAIDDATAAVKVQSDRLIAAVPPPRST